MRVPVIGYQTDEFPAFYWGDSGLNVSLRLDSAEEISGFAKTHWSLGMKTSVLVTNPIPAAQAIPKSEMEPILARASEEVKSRNIHGQAVTPFLMGRITELTNGKSLTANLGLLLNNARLAAQIAKARHVHPKLREI